MPPSQPRPETVWTVSALNFEVKTMLTQGIGTIWVEGEISNFARPASGHWYFTLKDQKSQVNAAMFRGHNSRVGFQPENGQKVLVRAEATLYEPQGKYQLIVNHLEDAGVGELMRRFEQLKARLAAEGLFEATRKKPLPAHPRRIALVTSTTGAAIRDVLSVIRRRAPHIPVLVFPTPVQGESAAAEIRRALARVRAHGGCDVVLLVRGGGSLEDLWCFNDEGLARDLADFPLPVVTGVGHEIDFTIVDFVADQRAPTPSVAAETVTPDRNELMQFVDDRVARLHGQLALRLERARERLGNLVLRLYQQHPTRQFAQLRMRLQHAQGKLFAQQRQRIREYRHRLRLAYAGLVRLDPRVAVGHNRERVRQLLDRQLAAIRQSLLRASHRITLQRRSLDALDPDRTLARGYARISKDDKLVKSATQLARDDDVRITLVDGNKDATIR